jgi:hypothetical protein
MKRNMVVSIIVLLVLATILAACGGKTQVVVVVTATSVATSEPTTIPTSTPTETVLLSKNDVLGSVVGRQITFREVYSAITIEGKESSADFMNDDTKELVKDLFSNVTYTWYSGQGFDMKDPNGSIIFDGMCGIDSETKLITCNAEEEYNNENGVSMTTTVEWDFDFSLASAYITFDRKGEQGDLAIEVLATFDQEITYVETN